jgi:hypothetical protein
VSRRYSDGIRLPCNYRPPLSTRLGGLYALKEISSKVPSDRAFVTQLLEEYCRAEAYGTLSNTARQVIRDATRFYQPEGDANKGLQDCLGHTA